jgi:hypothetical protein
MNWGRGLANSLLLIPLIMTCYVTTGWRYPPAYAFGDAQNPPEIALQVIAVPVLVAVLVAVLTTLATQLITRYYDKKKAAEERHPEEPLLGWVEHLELPSPPMSPSMSPYLVSQAIIDPSRFYGRKEEVQELYDRLFGESICSVEVLGFQHNGLTSFLYYASHGSVLARHLGADLCPIIFVYVNLNAAVGDPERFFGYLLNAAAKALEERGFSGVKSPPVPDRVTFHIAAEFFDRACRRGGRFAVLLDEFEQLTQHEFPRDFYYNLRALTQSRPVALVTTSFRPIHVLLRDFPPHPSPPYNIFHPSPIYLGALTTEDARSLVRVPADEAHRPFVPEEVEWVLYTAGRLPYLLQMIAEALYESRNAWRNPAEAQAAALSRCQETLENYFLACWSGLSGAERQVLSRLAHGSELAREDHKTVDYLAKYGLVESIGDGYRILGSALGDWIRGCHATEY